jgi:hypothetical protein
MIYMVIWDRAIKACLPVKRPHGEIGLTHDILAKTLYAVFCWYRLVSLVISFVAMAVKKIMWRTYMHRVDLSWSLLELEYFIFVEVPGDIMAQRFLQKQVTISSFYKSF